MRAWGVGSGGHEGLASNHYKTAMQISASSGLAQCRLLLNTGTVCCLKLLVGFCGFSSATVQDLHAHRRLATLSRYPLHQPVWDHGYAGA